MSVSQSARRAWEELSSRGVRQFVRAVYYIVASRIGKRKFQVLLPSGRFSVPGNRKKLGVGGYIYTRREQYEAELQPYFSQCQGAFVDVGANLGYWTCFVMQRAAGSGAVSSVVAFEPEASNFNFLKENVGASRQDLPDVQLVPAALGMEDTEAFICASNNDPGSFFVGRGGTRIQQLTLDTWISSHHLHDVGLIKIDVEGYEFEVLSGAVGTIQATKPVIICELIRSYLARNKRTPEDVFHLLLEIGYSAKFIGDVEMPCTKFVEDGNYVFSASSLRVP